MERVQYQQEEMLAELRDLTEKGLFTPQEVKLVIKKRTAFETNLVRKAAKKSDFLRYISYEMDLEQLRRKRAKRLGTKTTPATVSDFALVRRQFHLYERALKRFKSDVGLWIQYIEAAKREGARSLVGRITARALQLHTNVPALYVLAASHEMESLSPSSARTLLQRGLRLNRDSVELWTEYVKMEMMFVETLRRRWKVLGLEQEEPVQIEGSEDDHAEDFPGMNMNAGAEARKEVLRGAIVKSAIGSAVQAVPRYEMVKSLLTLIKEFPSAKYLRANLLDHLYEAARSQRESEDVRRLVVFYATRHLKGGDVEDEEDLVEAIQKCNQEMVSAVQDDGTGEVYGEFVREHIGAVEGHLRDYLELSVRSVLGRVESGRLRTVAEELFGATEDIRS